MKTYRILIVGILVLALAVFATAQLPPPQGEVQTSVCCEKTTSNLFCQNVPSSECAAGAKQAPTACSSTSFCREGTCYDSKEGTCLDNTPQLVCANNNGTWSQESPAACALGCCVLGDQAAFVSLVRCKKLSSSLGVKTNYRADITDETQCVLSVQNRNKGACVYDFEFQKTCKMTTRAECATGVSGATGAGEFFDGKLCTAEELNTTCAPTRQTTCLPGKDEVYFVDSCGNPANIYDGSKVNDNDYWKELKTKDESCGPNSANPNSASCGNCNYLLGSICRDAKSSGGATPTYGTNICADLNCKNTQNGKSYKHGESWCVYNDNAGTNKANAVGSRYFKHICINGEEVLEQCADFRNEVCTEDKLTTPQATFSQAGCTVNRWQDCIAQTEKVDCENTDRRDCQWKETTNPTTGALGVCVPQVSPGLKFWEAGDAEEVCKLANAQCFVKFEKGLFGDYECKDNCECLEQGWVAQRAELCRALGDCGPNVNWVGSAGYKSGYNVTIGKAPKSEK